MKIFGLYIIKQRTMDNLCERLAEDRKKAVREALVVPNGMITRLLRKHAEMPMLKQLNQRVLELTTECTYLKRLVNINGR